MKIETQLRKLVLLLEQNKFLESKSLLETINPEFFEEEFFKELNENMTNKNYGMAQRCLDQFFYEQKLHDFKQLETENKKEDLPSFNRFL